MPDDTFFCAKCLQHKPMRLLERTGNNHTRYCRSCVDKAEERIAHKPSEEARLRTAKRAAATYLKGPLDPAFFT